MPSNALRPLRAVTCAPGYRQSSRDAVTHRAARRHPLSPAPARRHHAPARQSRTPALEGTVRSMGGGLPRGLAIPGRVLAHRAKAVDHLSGHQPPAFFGFPAANAGGRCSSAFVTDRINVAPRSGNLGPVGSCPGNAEVVIPPAMSRRRVLRRARCDVTSDELGGPDTVAVAAELPEAGRTRWVSGGRRSPGHVAGRPRHRPVQTSLRAVASAHAVPRRPGLNLPERPRMRPESRPPPGGGGRGSDRAPSHVDRTSMGRREHPECHGLVVSRP